MFALSLSVSAAVFVSLISLVGVLTIAWGTQKLKGLVTILIALAVGALLGDAFIHLIPKSLEESTNPAFSSLLVIGGMIAFFIFERVFSWHHHGSEHLHSSKDIETHTPLSPKKPVGYLVLISDGIHNFVDGIIIAASFLVSVPVGFASTVAIILHEIPQELGDFGVLLHAGFTRAKALLYNLISALTAILGVLVVFAFGTQVEQLIFLALPIAAGTFIYIAASDLVPELHGLEKKRKFSFLLQLIAILVGVAAMYGLTFLE